MAQNLFNIKIMDSIVMSADRISDVIDLSVIDGFCVYAKWSGTPVGDLKLQASVDGDNYVDLTGSETAVSGPGDAMWEVTSALYDKIRLVYTRSSGTGSITAQINGKGLVV